MTFEKGQRIHIPGKDLPAWVTVSACLETPGGHTIFVETADGVYTLIELSDDEFSKVEALAGMPLSEGAEVGRYIRHDRGPVIHDEPAIGSLQVVLFEPGLTGVLPGAPPVDTTTELLISEAEHACREVDRAAR